MKRSVVIRCWCISMLLVAMFGVAMLAPPRAVVRADTLDQRVNEAMGTLASEIITCSVPRVPRPQMVVSTSAANGDLTLNLDVHSNRAAVFQPLVQRANSTLTSVAPGAVPGAPGSAVAASINDDGIVGIIDFLQVLQDWGACL